MITGCKTIAEYAVRLWMERQGFEMDNFTVTMDGNEAVITDQAGGSLAVRYDPASRTVQEAEEQEMERS